MDFVFTALLWMVGGFVYCNALEWIVHKYVLHGLGKKKNSFWSFHWRGHHKESRRNNFKDSRWDNIPLHKDKEFLGILFLAVMHAATLWISPVLYGTIVWRAVVYYRVHKKSHDDEDWAKQNVPWHWDHHMGPGKAVEANWCVTHPFFDNLMGTRVKYYLTTEYFLSKLKRKNKDEYKKIVGKLERIHIGDKNPSRETSSGRIFDYVQAEDRPQGNESRY